jgi:RNA methyltransferase, TrmH family
MTDRVTAARDPRVVRAARLLREERFRRTEGAFVVDGEGLLAEAVAAGVQVEWVLASEGAALPAGLPRGVPASVGAPDALRALAAVGQPPRVAAVCRIPAAPAPDPLPPGSLVLVRVSDAGNLGSILRTAAALRVPRVALAPGCADPWSRRALRASMGASFAEGLVAGGRALADLAAAQGRAPLAAAVPRGGRAPSTLPRGAAVVLGAEAEGLSDDEVALCDLEVTIPTPGFESLNVAAAAAILVWEARRGDAAGT